MSLEVVMRDEPAAVWWDLNKGVEIPSRTISNLEPIYIYIYIG